MVKVAASEDGEFLVFITNPLILAFFNVCFYYFDDDNCENKKVSFQRPLSTLPLLSPNSPHNQGRAPLIPHSAPRGPRLWQQRGRYLNKR